MKNKSLLFAFAAALALCAPVTSHARAKKTDASPTASPAASAAAAKASASPAASAAMQRAIPFTGLISAIDARAKTFTIAGKEKSRTFKITDKTVITKAGATASMKDVVANEEARGSYWKMADGSLEVKTLKVGPLTEAEKAAKESRKEKRAAKKATSGGSSPAASASPSAH